MTDDHAGARAATAGRPVAVCTLASRDLARTLAEVAGVAIAGPLATANLGVEALVLAVTERPEIRFLLVCGAESPLFGPGAALVALHRNGMCERRIVGCRSFRPQLPTIAPQRVEGFRRQVELVDARGERDPAVLIGIIAELVARDPGPDPADRAAPDVPRPFRRLRSGGRRLPLSPAETGFFVIRLDPRAGQVVVRHYADDLSMLHEMCGVRGESMLLGLLEAGLVTDPRHAGYLGAELAKAETALRLGLDYVQDLPLRRQPNPTTVRRPVSE